MTVICIVLTNYDRSKLDFCHVNLDDTAIRFSLYRLAKNHPSGHMVPKCRHIDVNATSSRRIDVITTSFLSSPLAGKRDIVVTILVRCMCVRPCFRPDLSGP